ncbi:MAG: ABC transporter ATP-binding protein [Lacunisphaera sp.]
MSAPLPAGLRVRDLAKRYGPVEALGGVSFDVAPGEIVGLLGLNGAGKTTTLEIVLGLRAPDSGTVELDGHNVLTAPERAKPLIGAVLQASTLPDQLTPREALAFFGAFYANALPPPELLAQFALTDKADAAFATLSGGQRQRLFLALAFLHRPRLLVLDEPTTGLDPRSRQDLHGFITAARAAGQAVLLSTHYLEEARQLCDRIALLHEGRLVASGRPDELIARSRATPRIRFTATANVPPAQLAALPGVTAHPLHERGSVLHTRDVGRTTAALVQLLAASGNSLRDLQIQQPTLEDVFFELTGRAWSEPEGPA